MSTKQARTITRDATVARTPDVDRMPTERTVAPEGRDPTKIYTRDGRQIDRLRFTGDEDRFNLQNMGVFPPQGWTYEWKVKTIKNWEWVDHQVELYQNGWTPVPAERHDGKIMPPGYKGPIERGGQVLMERDERLTAQARAVERRAANAPVIESRQMAGLMRNAVPGAMDSLDFDHGAARANSGVRIERTPRINDAKYTLEE